MTYQLFEGKGTVRKPKFKNKKFFEYLKDKLGFAEEIDLWTFCTAIALFKEHQGKTLNKKDELSLQEMAKMYSFKKAPLYDFITLNYLEIQENRLVELEKYFYAGFEFLRDWFENLGPDSNSEIERFCEIWDYIISADSLDD